MFTLVLHITVEYRLESVQTAGYFSNSAVDLARANGRSFWMARSLMLWLLCVQQSVHFSSLFPCRALQGYSLEKSWPSDYNIRLSLRHRQKQVPLKHYFTARTPFSTAKAIHHFYFPLTGDCSSRSMDPFLMIAVQILMQLYWLSLCQERVISFINGHIQVE